MTTAAPLRLVPDPRVTPLPTAREVGAVVPLSGPLLDVSAVPSPGGGHLRLEQVGLRGVRVDAGAARELIDLLTAGLDVLDREEVTPLPPAS